MRFSLSPYWKAAIAGIATTIGAAFTTTLTVLADDAISADEVGVISGAWLTVIVATLGVFAKANQPIIEAEPVEDDLPLADDIPTTGAPPP